MNGEALAHAAKACRESARLLRDEADRIDVAIHRCPDAGAGMRAVADDIRARAIGLTVAASFMTRCARVATLTDALSALEAGHDVYVVPGKGNVVVAGEEQPAQARLTLRARVVRMLGRSGPARAA